MATFYKLLFDLSLYYTLTGFYLRCVSGKAPSAACFLALTACAAVAVFLLRVRNAQSRLLRALPLPLPLAALLTHPGLIPFLHCLPAWAYLAFSIMTDRTEISYNAFRHHFGFGLKCLLLLVFGPLFPTQLSQAALGTIPYLVLMLVSGVCMLRVLREKHGNGIRQGLYMTVFVLLCAGLTLGHAPQMLAKGMGYVYRGIVAPAVFLLAVALAAALYIFYLLAKWLVAKAQGENPPLELSLQSMADAMGLESQYKAYTTDLRWLKTLLIVLFAAFLAFLLFLLFRRLLGERSAAAPRALAPEKRSVLSGGQVKRAPGRLRPRDPRLAVRWYYARFLEECGRRGMHMTRGMTVAEVSTLAAPLFPGADVDALAKLYVPARYHLSRRVTKEEARLASEAWNILRRSESPAYSAKTKNKRKNP